MYISLSLLLNVILGSLGIAALILFIILILKVLKLVNNINSLIDSNKNNITKACSNLPTISKNAITDVATEATAEAIVAKDNFLSNYETIKDIINIIASIFIK